jgi:hypothetical protein
MGELKMQGTPSLGTVLGAVGALLGLAALIVSLSASADASPSSQLVRRGDIAPGAVTAKALARNAVHPRALARHAVNSRALAKEAVNRRILGKGAVLARAIAADAVTAGAIAPGSVYGGALGTETVHATPIADIDEVAENGTWTAGNTEVAVCAPGEALLSPGFIFTNPGNREVAWLEAHPFLTTDGSRDNGVSGRITSNSGGSAEAVIMALCLQ